MWAGLMRRTHTTCRQPKMEDVASSFCVVAAAVFFFTVLWKFKEGCGAGTRSGALVGALVGAISYLFGLPAVGGTVFLGCSLVLIRETERRVELLQSRAVLITGCDSGFGLALATRLSEAGLRVFAGVLDVNGEGAQQLRQRGCERLRVLQLDVTDGVQVDAAHRYICTQLAGAGLWGLVNNAGILLCPVDAEIQPITAYRRCVEVNFLSAVRVCQVFLPLLRRSRGRIINMSSMAGEVPMPLFAAYGASKAALSVFSAVMRMELSEWGVKVAVVQPMGFKTNIFGNADAEALYRDEILAAVSSDAREDYGDAYISSLPGSLSKMSHQAATDLSPVLDDLCHALLSVRPKALYTPGQMGWLLPLLQRCCPTAIFDTFIKVLVKVTDLKPKGLSRS